MAASTQPVIEPRVFRVFISYASEDLPIAAAIGSCLKVALGDFFAEVNLDKWFLQPGLTFKKQIESKLQKTDVFIIVYTGTEKQSHGYTGWEVGYFDHVMEVTSGRLKIALYLDSPPAISAEEQGIPLNLGRDKLELTCEEFESQLVVAPDDPICLLLEKWQGEVGRIVEATGFPKPQKKPEQDPAACVRSLKLAIFRYLKGTVETIVEPQKQITIRVKGSALEQAIDNLPPDAELRPNRAGVPMAIFGLQDEPLTWDKFLAATADNRFCDSWREAITSVVMSSFPDRVNVDNSQIILSSDEVKAYRVILTKATKYYDDCREFSLFFVELLHRPDYGDESTSILLKGLELVCRFRFMFLETDSEFSSQNILSINIERFSELASRLLKELNLLRKDSRDAGLDEPRIWRKFVTWDHIKTMSAEYRPRELRLREIVARIAAAKGQPNALAPLREELSRVLEEMENGIRPENTLLMREMARKLEEIAEDEHSQSKLEAAEKGKPNE
jgi:TIR domain